MVFYDTNSRLQFAREHADRLTTEMRRTRRLSRDEAGFPRWAALASAATYRVERLRRRASRHAPAFNA
jgi:hypothetical protein